MMLIELRPDGGGHFRILSRAIGIGDEELAAIYTRSVHDPRSQLVIQTVSDELMRLAYGDTAGSC